MAIHYNNKITTNGLVLCLDAGDKNSYPSTGTTWYDVSGNNRNYTFGTNIAWNSLGYFDCTGGVFTGPASNTFDFNIFSEHYIEVYVKVTSASTNTFFNWEGNTSAGVGTRAIFSHLYYSNGSTYYDINGCCGSDTRIQYVNDTDLTAGIRHVAWRTRSATTPNREFFKNLVVQMSSGTSTTATVLWSNSTAASIASGWLGQLYLIRVYNRPLSDTEMYNNYIITKSRFGL